MYCYRLFVLFLLIHCADAFVTFGPGRRPWYHLAANSSPSSVEADPLLLEEIRSMRIKDIKNELSSLRITTTDVFEKEELVQRLCKARLERQKTNGRTDRGSNEQTTQPREGVIQAPLYLTSLDRSSKVAAVNLPGDGGLTIDQGEQPYATIKIEVEDKNGGSSYTLSLLLDTACSGFVLRPEVVKRYNLPSYSTPVTMTGAGGTSATTGLTQLQCFRVGGESFGPLPAAVQDIGALPASLDGIIGLSFLNQFAAVEMDFRQGLLSFFRKPPSQRSDLKIVATSDMRMLPRLGIYTTDVHLGGRGPVRMLVDTGAACTLLNWKGVAALGLSRDSNFISRLQSPMGAMGSDSIAVQLTHRLNVSSKLDLGHPSSNNPGLSLSKSTRLSVDIGSVPVLDNLESEGVGGILGVDALLRCAVVRLDFRSPLSLTLLNQKD